MDQKIINLYDEYTHKPLPRNVFIKRLVVLTGSLAAGVPYELYIYEEANHAFHNDTSAARYHEAAAKRSWQRTLAFFEKHLG